MNTMKLLENLKNQEDLFEMANLPPRKTGVKARIWSDGRGIERNKPDSLPRVKLQIDDKIISISIEQHPKILAKSKGVTVGMLKQFKSAIVYVGRNYELFLKHYNDTTDEFGDEELIDALKSRKEYK